MLSRKQTWVHELLFPLCTIMAFLSASSKLCKCLRHRFTWGFASESLFSSWPHSLVTASK